MTQLNSSLCDTPNGISKQKENIYSNETPFLKVPIPLIDTSICVPGTRYFGGLNPAPTPKQNTLAQTRRTQHTSTDIVNKRKKKLTPRCPRHNNTPLLQRRPLRKIRNQIRTIKQ